MGAVTLWGIPLVVPAFLWLVIYGACIFVIAKRCEKKYFLNGFMLGLLNIGWLTGFHVIFYKTYLTNNPAIELLYSLLPLSESPRLGMILMAPIYGSFSGLLVGFFAFLVAKVTGK